MKLLMKFAVSIVLAFVFLTIFLMALFDMPIPCTDDAIAHNYCEARR